MYLQTNKAVRVFMQIILVILSLGRRTFVRCSSEISFEGDRHLEYKPTRSIHEQDNLNRIDLRFRTIHPSGLLVLMVGKYESTLVLQLVQGKLRYSIAHRSKEPSQLIFGTNLNDNKWHRVTVLRTGRVNEITVDSDSKLLLSPLSFETVTVNKMSYIAGFNHYKLGNSWNVVASRFWFVGCLEIRQIDNRDPIEYYQRGYQRIKVIPSGGLVFGCQGDKNTLFSFNIPSSRMTVNFHNSANQSILTLSLVLRTFNLNGNIASTRKSQCYARVGLRSGKVFMEVIQQNGYQVAKIISKESVNDGQWHEVLAAVSDTDIFLRVDSYQRLSETLQYSLAENCLHVKSLMFGGTTPYSRDGFVGCLDKIKYNSLVVQNNKRTEYDLTRVSVSMSCNLVDKCYPNPCRNSALCSQSWKEYECDCGGTHFYGKTCDISIYKPTCSAYQQMGLKKTSYCLIDPDDDGDLQPYTTLCKFDEQRQAYTAVHHNKATQFAATDGEQQLQHYVFHIFKYEQDMNAIEALISRSKYCRQWVSFKCFNTPLLNAPQGPPNVGWRSRNGELKSHWGGVVDNGKGCACGVNSSCIEPSKLCNCDAAKTNIWTEDSGYLTDKQNLPITRLNVAGMKTGSGFFQIGPLECFGELHDKKSKVPVPSNILQRVCITVEKKIEKVKVANDTSANIIVEPEFDLDINIEHTSTNTPLVISTPQLPPTRLWQSHQPSTKKTTGGKSLSLLEIILITIAGLAVLILVVKFVFCNLLGKLHGQVILNKEELKSRKGSLVSTACTMTSTLPSDAGTARRKGSHVYFSNQTMVEHI